MGEAAAEHEQDEPQVVDHAAGDASHADIVEQTKPDQGGADGKTTAMRNLTGELTRPDHHGRDLVAAAAQGRGGGVVVLGE